MFAIAANQSARVITVDSVGEGISHFVLLRCVSLTIIYVIQASMGIVWVIDNQGTA
jgi:hypothetical protein